MGPLISNLRLLAPPPETAGRATPLLGLPSRFLARSDLPSQITEIDRRCLAALSAERDPDLMFESLLSVAGRWESQGKDDLALALYTDLLPLVPEGSAGSARLRRRADTLLGTGRFGDRVEHAARHFFQQATDPAMIFGFMVAGSVATAVRGYATASLALRGGSLLSRGWGARAFAGGAAYAAEVPAFVGATRLAHGALGYPGGFGEIATLPGELGGAALFLGALKLSGWGASALAGRSAWRPAILTGGTLSGIYAGHRLEESLGLRPAALDETQRWFEAGETFLQLRVGGRIASALGGGAHSALVPLGLRRLEAESAVDGIRWSLSPRGADPLRAVASMRGDEDVTQPVLRREIDTELLRTQLSQSLGERATTKVAQSVQGIGNEITLGEALTRMVGGSQYQDLAGFELALRRLDYAANHAYRRGLTGSYLNWVARVAAESAVRRQDQPRFDRLIQYLAEGASILQLESLVSELEPRFRLFSENILLRSKRIAELMTLRSESHRLIRTLPLSREARQTLHAYDRIVPMQDRLPVAKVIDGWLKRNPEHQDLVREVLLGARLNPAGGMRAQRMINVMMYEPSNVPKLRELVDSDLGIRGGRHFEPPFHQAELILNTQHDGYLAEPDLARQLSLLYRRLPDLLDPEQAVQRRARTQRILEQVWPDNRTPVNEATLRQALSLLGDPVADAIERDMAADRFRLRILPRDEFETMFFEGVSEKHRGKSFGALFIPAVEDSSGRDSIYLMTVPPASHGVHREYGLLRMVQLVHEHVHFQRASRQTDRSPRGVYLEEMLAETQAFHWRAEQGDIRFLEKDLADNAAGLGLFLRDWVNLTYFIPQDREP